MSVIAKSSSLKVFFIISLAPTDVATILSLGKVGLGLITINLEKLKSHLNLCSSIEVILFLKNESRSNNEVIRDYNKEKTFIVLFLLQSQEVKKAWKEFYGVSCYIS